MSMRQVLRDRPWYQLTNHFFRGLFDFGILSDAGSDSFRRLLFGIVGVTLTFGLLLTRMYLAKYSALSEMFHDFGAGYTSTQGPYHLAILGDGTLAIAFPMLIVGFVLVLVSNSLFPDEIDCRVLLPLPVSKRLLFASKALAVMLFTSLFAIAAHVAMIPLVVLMRTGRWADQGLLTQLAAHAVASLGASLVTSLVIVAAVGVLWMCLPRLRWQAASTVFRGVALCGLMVSIPLASRLPTIGALITSESPLGYLIPPIWFISVQELMLGDTTPHLLRLAQVGAVVAASSFAIALGSYWVLYRRFERVISRSVVGSSWFGRRRQAATAAIGPFIRATLGRSPLHQGVFVAISACGVGAVLNAFLGDSGVSTLVWAPFALVFVMIAAVRAALVLPIELRANWIFRVTEDEATRAQELNTVVRTVILLGVVLPLALLFPLEWAVLGPRAIYCMSIAFLGGLVLVEVQMAQWQRIPFTCSYAPSRQWVGFTLLISVAAFIVFTAVGSRLVSYGFSHPVGWLVSMTILGAVFWHRRRQRLWFSQRALLMFEDVLPNEIEPLRLSEY